MKWISSFTLTIPITLVLELCLISAFIDQNKKIVFQTCVKEEFI